jgi:hypothetical protein
VYAKVYAINVYGFSELSLQGNGAAIITYPDAPVNFVEDYSLRQATELGLQWSEGAANGGSPVLDYEISYNEATGSDFVVLVSGLGATSYTATGLTSGETYLFKVKARNVFGLSVFSQTLSLKAAFKPAQPTPPMTSVIGSNIVIDWVAPNANGSPITAYRVSIK